MSRLCRTHLADSWRLRLLARILTLLECPLADLGEVEALGDRRLSLAATQYLTVVSGRLELLVLLHRCCGLRVGVRTRHTGKKVESTHMSALEVVSASTDDAADDAADCGAKTGDDASECRASGRTAEC